MMKNRMYVILSILFFVLSMFGSPVTSVHADSELSSVKAFNNKIAQLQVGSDIEILALGVGRIDIKITEVGPDYIEGYVSDPFTPGDDWWTTRYYFKKIKVIDNFTVPIEDLPEPVIQVEKKSKQQVTEHVPSKGSQSANEIALVIVKAIGYVILFALYFAVLLIFAAGGVLAG